jgi:hypothetical protein
MCCCSPSKWNNPGNLSMLQIEGPFNVYPTLTRLCMCVCVHALVFKSMQHPTMVLHVCVCVCVYVLCVSVCLPFGFSISEHPLSC